MSAYMTKEQRAARDADFERRMQPRLVWPSQQDGTLWMHRKPTPKKSKARWLTEAEDNAIGRVIRRRQNRRLRGWLPYAKR